MIYKTLQNKYIWKQIQNLYDLDNI
jgi:hypothetical protein